MVNTEYAIAYREVLEILKYIPIEDYNKIPKDKIELFEKNANNYYSFSYNPDKTLEEQGVSKIAKGIIAILFRDYWSTDIQREKIIARQNCDRQKIEKQKREKYNLEEIFKSKYNNFNIQTVEKQEEKLKLVEHKKLKWYQKLFSKIIKILRKK